MSFIVLAGKGGCNSKYFIYNILSHFYFFINNLNLQSRLSVATLDLL